MIHGQMTTRSTLDNPSHQQSSVSICLVQVHISLEGKHTQMVSVTSCGVTTQKVVASKRGHLHWNSQLVVISR